MEDIKDFLFEPTDELIDPFLSFEDMEDSILEDNDDDSGVCYCIDPSSSFEDMKNIILMDDDCIEPVSIFDNLEDSIMQDREFDKQEEKDLQ